MRAAAGNPGTHCPTCGRAPAAPYRRTFAGAVVEGCVDPCHTAALATLDAATSQGPSVAWHFRPEAAAIRASVLEGLEALDKPSPRPKRRASRPALLVEVSL